MQRKSALRRVLYILAGLVAAYLAVCFQLARNYIRPARVVPTKPEWLRDVMVETRFGPTPSWSTPGLVEGRASRVVFVMAHGYGGTRETWAEPMADLHAQGFDCLALAMPGQDASPVQTVGFGITEGHTIADAVRWTRAKTHGKSKIVVLGLSMGGAASWLASTEEPSIDGIVTEGAYARFDEAMDRFFNRKMPGGSIVLSPVVSFAKRMTGLKPEEVRPVDAAAKWHGRPALVIQGGADTLITLDQGRSLAEAADCPEWVVPGSEHAQCFETDRAGYVGHLVQFARKVVGW